MRLLVSTALATCLGASTASSQALQAGRFQVTPLLGTIRWDNASALANKEADEETGEFSKTVLTPSVGLSADYKVWRELGVGFYFEAARPTTRGDYFPSVLFNFGATLPAELRTVSQRVTVMMYGVQGSFEFGVGKLLPYVTGGLGAVTVNQDPQQSDGNSSYTTGQFQLGGGLGYQVSSSTTLRLDVRDFVFTSWDREVLNPVNPAFQNTLFPSANGSPPAEKSTVHNFRLAIGFSYVPRGNASASPENTQDQE
jgi:opacity protein-like surface antigen